MILKYWYSDLNTPLIFGVDYKIDKIDVGSILHTNDFYVKKLSRDLAAIGRRFIKFERQKPPEKGGLV